MTDAVAKIPRPTQMRGALTSSFKIHLGISLVLMFAGGIAYKIFVGDARKAKYAEFYRTYDTEKAFNEMRNKGLFQSCPAD